VRIRFGDSYPPIADSSELVKIEISRVLGVTPPGGTPTLNQNVDRYLGAISRILAEANASSRWQRMSVHAPFVQVDVEIGGTKTTLLSGYSRDALETFSDDGETDRKHRAALLAILKLTAEYLQVTWPVK
jgi:hypothetical protein